jgi:pimeloyl-ACP methyl ester carboxylesterase
VAVEWELREAGPSDAEHTVLLLPGGMCSAGSYAEVMAEPALAGMRLVAATLPGHAGAPPPQDYSIENYARWAAEVARNVGADVVVGFSMGASVATLPRMLTARVGGERRSPRATARRGSMWA